MLNRSASLAMSTSVLKALPGKVDIKRHSPSILYFTVTILIFKTVSIHYYILVTLANSEDAMPFTTVVTVCLDKKVFKARNSILFGNHNLKVITLTFGNMKLEV